MTAPIGCLDGEQAIRDALAAGPTPGPWHVGGRDASTIYDRYSQRLANSFEGVMVSQRSDTECKANATLIAACYPETMQAVMDELDRLRSASRQEGWQPIADAPKDGTEILLSNGEVVQQGWWMEHEGGTSEYRDTEGRYLGQNDDDGFIGWWDVGGCMQPGPTHWQPMPLAAAPHQSQEAQGDRHGE